MNGKRKHERYSYEQDVEIIHEDGQLTSGRLINFSLGGAFIALSPQPEFGSKIVLQLNLPGVPDLCKIPCFVRWTKPDYGVGIQFEYTRPIEIWALIKLIHKLQE